MRWKDYMKWGPTLDQQLPLWLILHQADLTGNLFYFTNKNLTTITFEKASAMAASDWKRPGIKSACLLKPYYAWTRKWLLYWKYHGKFSIVKPYTLPYVQQFDSYFIDLIWRTREEKSKKQIMDDWSRWKWKACKDKGNWEKAQGRQSHKSVAVSPSGCHRCTTDQKIPHPL